MYSFQNKKFKEKRKALRNHSTEAEIILWSVLKRKQLLGYKFIRQYSVESYILDFYCPAKKIAIELDGSQHAEEEIKQYDDTRTIHLESHKIKVLRFWNSEVKVNLKSVLTTIVRELEA